MNLKKIVFIFFNKIDLCDKEGGVKKEEDFKNTI